MRLSLFAEIFNMLLMTIILGVAVYLLVLIVKALKKYINSKEIREEKSIIQRSLGEELKAQRLRCKMTQEFVADALASADRPCPNGRPEQLIRVRRICWRLRSSMVCPQKNF